MMDMTSLRLGDDSQKPYEVMQCSIGMQTTYEFLGRLVTMLVFSSAVPREADGAADGGQDDGDVVPLWCDYF